MRGGTKDSATTKQLVHLLATPLDDLPGGVETVLRLEHYAVLMAHLDFDTNRQMAVRIVTSVIKHATKISTTPQVGRASHSTVDCCKMQWNVAPSCALQYSTTAPPPVCAANRHPPTDWVRGPGPGRSSKGRKSASTLGTWQPGALFQRRWHP